MSPTEFAGDGDNTSAFAVSIIVISYNTREMTLACLASIAQQTKSTHEVIVVDNASDDGSADAIAAAYPDVQLIRETTNHGFAGAHPIAVARARFPYLLLLNPDTVVLDHAIDTLLAFARSRPNARIWGGRTRFADGRLNPASCWRQQGVWTSVCTTFGFARLFPNSAIMNPEAYGGWPRDTVGHVDIVSGCFLLIERAFWDELGGFDPVFFMYGEEADLCLRARAFGADPITTPDAEIVHHGGASDTVRADKLVRLLRAKIELLHRHVPGWRGTVAVQILRLWPLLRHWVMALAATLRLRPTAKVKRDIWAEVWQRRAEWRAGLSDG